MRFATASQKDAERHYSEHKGKEFFRDLVLFLISGPIIPIVLEGKNCVEVVRKMVGSASLDKRIPGTIRFDYCNSKMENLIHASDSEKSAKEEIGFWF